MKKLNTLENHIGYWLRFVSNHVSTSFAKKLADYDIGVGDWVVLNLLREQNILSPADIAKITGMTRGATSKLLDRLCGKQLISRTESLQDRRYQEIALSINGKKLLPELIKLANSNDRHFFGHLSKAEKGKLIALLKEITFIQKMDEIPIK